MQYLRVIVALASGIAVTAQTISGQYDCLPAGGFTLCQNLWGICKYILS